ncbi:hypothetical protein [Accumulibacter sp.]|uniref:hypothetical protein n=1 Tax=Accumulibacter sp. TaxID=2053492 RepID=UPI0025EE3B35|nr:hypothetical protein [Accumulibacter sp.]MCM8625129.1 hypothetical protein [Accumulibacter sp.]
MTTTPFLRPRLTGVRFDRRAIPLEFLKDLAVFEEMIVEIAKSAFLTDHPDRKRSPRGFTEGIELKLTGIEDGSAIPVISLIVTSATLFPTDSQLYFERARDSVVRAISAAEHQRAVTEYLPERALGYFDRIGRSLRDGEAMEFEVPDGQGVARLTKETRRKLLLASANVKELTEEVTIRGYVPEIDQADMTFEIQLPDGRKVKSPLATQHLDTILEAFNGYKAAIRVMLQGIGRFNRSERLLGLDSVEHVSLLDPLDVPARLEEIFLLKDGWIEGKGVSPPKEGLEWLSRSFATHYPDDLVLPYLYPTPEGGIQMEWTLGKTEVSLEIDLFAHAAHWHTLDLPTEEEASRVVRLDESDGWKWLVAELRRLAGGAA